MCVLSPGKEAPARAGGSQEEVTRCSSTTGVHLSAMDHPLAATRHLESICDIVLESR